MAFRVERDPTYVNPELEEIRNEVLQKSSAISNDWIDKMINATSIIHAGFLFHDSKTLQNLCLYMSGTQNKITDPGWEALGNSLGLNPCALKVISYNNFNKEDPTYNTLLAYVQYEDATIGKLIQSLKNIGRIDVISRLKKSLDELVENVIQQSNRISSTSGSGECSGYESHSEEDSICSQSNETSEQNILNMLKPKLIPPAPFVFQNIRTEHGLTLQCTQQPINKLNNVDVICLKNKSSNSLASTQQSGENKQKFTPSNPNEENMWSTRRKHYEKIFMLTFAADSEKFAHDVCKVLRKERADFPKIGVLMLSEHVNEVSKDPYGFITGSFHQVDYICPILSESYFNLIRRKEKFTNFSDLQLDARYAQFIYTLMSNYYIANKCLNDKIRCIIPDELIPQIECNLLMAAPIFGAWIKLSEVEELARRLVKPSPRH